ncbi:MAG: aldehyde dehydrogenase family protein [Rhodobacteraceae bacterium]|nr:aldehyde dehydrogenase family protein [Paracoccaceae bacterium]
MTDLSLIPALPGADLPAAPQRLHHWIGGAWIDSADGATSARTSPAHGVPVSVAARGGRAEAEAAIAAARAAFDAGDWPHGPASARAALLLKVADLIDRDRAAIAHLEVLESGKPITQALAEIAGAADLWRHASALARTQHGDSHNSLGPDMLGLVLREPVGVAALITPWNFPFLIASQKLPYALAAGCTCVLKPSELTPGTTVMLGRLLAEAGLPEGVVNIVLGFGDPVGEVLATDPRVDMVSFTGSTAVGRRISANAAATLKKVSLELGGKNPQVIFPDADLDEAADAIAFGVYFNAGECCNASSRIIAHADVAGALVERVVALSRRVRFGDPLDPRTQVGAIVTPEHLDKIDAHVRAARDSGARVALGGSALNIDGLPGQFYAPTVVDHVRPDMPIACEEVFGPVLSVLRFESFDQAVALVNGTDYGLSAGVWSRDVSTCLDFARRARAGTVWTNTWMDGFPELPFGGFGQSGQGRELGRYGLEEFQEVKTVTMRIGRTRAPWVS